MMRISHQLRNTSLRRRPASCLNWDALSATTWDFDAMYAIRQTVCALTLILLFALAQPGGADTPPAWLDPSSSLRRIVYLDSSWASRDLVDFPLDLRFGPSGWPIARVKSVSAYLEPGRTPVPARV